MENSILKIENNIILDKEDLKILLTYIDWLKRQNVTITDTFYEEKKYIRKLNEIVKD